MVAPLLCRVYGQHDNMQTIPCAYLSRTDSMRTRKGKECNMGHVEKRNLPASLVYAVQRPSG
jgi:hypothetical protein